MTVLDWAPDEKFAAAADRWEAAHAVDHEGVRELAGRGLLGLTVPQRYGGRGTPLVEVVDLHRAVAAHSPSLQSLLVVHGMVCHAVTRWGRQELRERVLPKLAFGEHVAAFALTEQESGNDVQSLRTTLRQDGDQVLVTGRKRWISFGQIADVHLVFGRGDGGGACALVPAGAGAVIRAEQPTTGLGASLLADIEYADTPTEAALTIARPGFGIPHVATSCLTLGRLLIAAAAAGVAQRAVDLAAEHVAQRVVGDGPLGDRQLVRALLADVSTAAESAWLTVQDAARRVDDGDPDAAVLACRAKLLASRAAASATQAAARLFGAAGLVEDHPVVRLCRAADTYQVIEGPTEVLQDLVGGAVVRRARVALRSSGRGTEDA
ncbi:acyl-CoA dehydrogenase family protein [Lentzea sp. CA-135723]|uniref:acyl-CoA dehydrogenase family protein n=1 Tax=Lentzea sp. CA-135723 TaxID=3239950 RepID=UPI003D926F68